MRGKKNKKVSVVRAAFSILIEGKNQIIRGEMLDEIIDVFKKYGFSPQSIDINKAEDCRSIVFQLEKLMTCSVCKQQINKALSNKKGEWKCDKCWKKKEVPSRVCVWMPIVNQKDLGDWFQSVQAETDEKKDLSDADLYVTPKLPD